MHKTLVFVIFSLQSSVFHHRTERFVKFDAVLHHDLNKFITLPRHVLFTKMNNKHPQVESVISTNFSYIIRRRIQLLIYAEVGFSAFLVADTRLNTLLCQLVCLSVTFLNSEFFSSLHLPNHPQLDCHVSSFVCVLKKQHSLK